MHAWEQIQKTLEVIEENLKQPPDINELAKTAALSPFYYQRLFSRLVKKPVAEYIKQRRLSVSLPLLAEGEDRILDIAMNLGFSSHEHFTRCFKESFGLTPEEYRKAPRMLHHISKPELLLNYVLVDEGVPLITDGIVLEVNRKTLEEDVCYIGLSLVAQMGGAPMGDTPMGDAPIGDAPTGKNDTQEDDIFTATGEDPMAALWDKLHSEKESIPAVKPQASELGVMYGADKPGYYTYFAGAKAQGSFEEGALPEGFEVYTLKAGQYAVCGFEAENFEALVTEALFKATNYLYEMFLPGHKLSAEPFCAEVYERHDEDTTYMELWMKLKD